MEYVCPNLVSKILQNPKSEKYQLDKSQINLTKKKHQNFRLYEVKYILAAEIIYFFLNGNIKFNMLQ